MIANVLTELLTWHWQSPVWLVTPVVYESYRVLQLMRGLKLGAELSAPAWMMHTIRGLLDWVIKSRFTEKVVFAGFSAETLAQRIMDCKPKAVITCNAVKRGPKVLNLKEIVDVGLTECAKNGISVDVCLTYENQLATNRESTKWQEGRDIWWQLKGLQNLVI
ncbi:hypothetical protein LWI29_022829 [Acer saccharum]|uniref:Uncharacterized protein n=1 Tax=Acer saccharum TaxID=4024 RepID=A0AA39VKX1_ACESA|nr:hypothetical protein LWI29_022829 [Acer saccharum]